MKKLFIMALITFCFVNITTAQNKDDRYREYTGRYGSNDGVCLFDDGHFMLYGYAVAVFGSYKFEDNYINFHPDQPELFEVYATYNKTLGNKTRMDYVGFDRGDKTYVQYDGDKASRVFNDNANCFSGPFVNELPKQIKKIRLSNSASGSDKINNSWYYNNDKGYNDFVLVYNRSTMEYENFSGLIKKKNNEFVLKTSNFGSDKGYIKKATNADRQKEWQEILAAKEQYYKRKENKAKSVYANKHYQAFEPDLTKYTFDKASGQYIIKNATDNEEYFRQNQYNDNRYLRLYTPLQPYLKNNSSVGENEANPSSVFFTSCTDSSKESYRYKGYMKYKEEKEEKPLPGTMAPVPIKAIKNNTDSRNL
ncbi:hypothetical protein [Elizabethkingia meningoseptica]|uniref:hypothetical protein n=1 Tax=Elizabethkingia meningoseptica TaxID=238 RepID=UPI0038913443